MIMVNDKTMNDNGKSNPKLLFFPNNTFKYQVIVYPISRQQRVISVSSLAKTFWLRVNIKIF